MIWMYQKMRNCRFWARAMTHCRWATHELPVKCFAYCYRIATGLLLYNAYEKTSKMLRIWIIANKISSKVLPIASLFLITIAKWFSILHTVTLFWAFCLYKSSSLQISLKFKSAIMVSLVQIFWHRATAEIILILVNSAKCSHIMMMTSVDQRSKILF